MNEALCGMQLSGETSRASLWDGQSERSQQRKKQQDINDVGIQAARSPPQPPLQEAACFCQKKRESALLLKSFFFFFFFFFLFALFCRCKPLSEEAP